MPVIGWKLIPQLLYLEYVERGNLDGDIKEEIQTIPATSFYIQDLFLVPQQ